MRKLLPLLLALCLSLTSCVKIEGGAKDTGNPNGAQGNSTAETIAQENPGGAVQESAPAEPFALYPAYMQLPLGQHVTLDADTAPAGKKLTWTSSDTSVATVDENGRVTPVAEGEAVITAALADDTDVTSTCGVLVVTEGNIYLWEYEPEDLEAFRAETEPEAEEE